jgi:hypothetical protein
VAALQRLAFAACFTGLALPGCGPAAAAAPAMGGAVIKKAPYCILYGYMNNSTVIANTNEIFMMWGRLNVSTADG